MKYLIASFFILVFMSSDVLSQSGSEKLKKIINNNSFSQNYKEKKLDSLLEGYLKNKIYDTLYYDTYQVLKWCYDIGKLDKAILLNKKNVHLMDSLDFKEIEFYRKNLYSLGYYQMYNNENKDALMMFNKVLGYNINDDLALFASYFIASIVYKTNDFYAAAQNYERSIQIAKEVNNIGYAIDCSLYASLCYKIINTDESIEKAIQILNDAITYNKEKYDAKTSYYLGYIAGLSSLHRHLANAYNNNKKDYEFENAKTNYEKALKYAQKINDSIRLAYVYHDLGFLYHHTNDDKALKYFDKASTYKPDQILQYHIYDNKSTFYLERKEYENAKRNIQKALKVLSPELREEFNELSSKEDLLASANKYLTVSSLINKAEIFIEIAENNKNEINLYHNAIKTLKNADFLIDIIRLESKEFKSKLFWRDLSSRIYTSATKACYAINNTDEAFYFMEKNKALLLLEDILLENKKNTNDIPQEVNKRYNDVKNEMIKYSNVSDSLLKQKLIAKTNYNQFVDSLEYRHQLYYKSIKPANIIKLKEFQEYIKDDNKCYLEYVLNETDGYGILITREVIEFFKIDNIETLRDDLVTYTKSLKNPIKNLIDKERYNKLSFSIYSSLFPSKVTSRLKNKTITIIPDDILLNIPFEALNTSTKNEDYLILKNQINYAYSLTFLKENEQIIRRNTNNIIGFAPINFSPHLPDLKNTKTEIDIIKNLFDAKTYTHHQSTKSNFITSSTDFKIIHLASHASASKKQEPYIVFSDSELSLNDLYSVNNSAELVVLSACESSIGELNKGEGLMSLTRGFFNIGANSVMSSLWTVDDSSTSNIMENFYTNLKDGESKSSALHNAKLNYLKTHSLSETSPYYWSSFILIGNSDAINFNNDNNDWLYWIVGTLICLSIILIWTKKK